MLSFFHPISLDRQSRDVLWRIGRTSIQFTIKALPQRCHGNVKRGKTEDGHGCPDDERGTANQHYIPKYQFSIKAFGGGRRLRSVHFYCVDSGVEKARETGDLKIGITG